MTLEDTLRVIVREEIRALREDLQAWQATPSASGAELLTYAQAAALKGLGYSTIRAWAESGRLNKHGEGRNVRVSKLELDRVMGPRQSSACGGKLTEADIEAKAEAILRKRGR